MSAKQTKKSWSQHVAGLGVDMLVDNGLIKKEDFELAVEIVAEEIWVRLTMEDYPPMTEDRTTSDE
ncbi:hypothetical protein [Baaleninema simplex]|uniref:hypothetical protein n=1 Tax=Baaleninema simplex TaxID=2862350 RepID=UPI0003805A2E|nr:hypothetical protein [Baaleninema simplex]